MNDKPKTNAVATTSEVSFVPFGSNSSIKLNVTIIKHYVCIPTKNGKLCSDRDAVRFMMLCRSRGLNPFEGDCFLQGYDGKNGPEFSLITAHQAFLKRAELHPEFNGMESGVIVKNDDKVINREGDFMLDEDVLLGAWATIHFKNRKVPMVERLNLRTFAKGYGRWEIDPAGMIVKCAQASALRTAFPTQIGGMYLREEIEVKTDAPTLTGTGEIEVQTVTVDTDKKSEGEEVPKADPGSTPTVQDELSHIVTSAGFTFQDLIAWGDETGNIADATSVPDFAAIPTKVAQRLILAKKGLIKGLELLKKPLQEIIV